MYTRLIDVIYRDFDVKDRFLFYRIYCVRCEDRRRKISVTNPNMLFQSPFDTLSILSWYIYTETFRLQFFYLFPNLRFINLLQTSSPYRTYVFIVTPIAGSKIYPDSRRSIVVHFTRPKFLFTSHCQTNPALRYCCEA